MKNLLRGLNPPQKKAVQADQGPFLIIAGAGSGKTTALTRRVAYLIRERAVPAHNILAVTFTNKAAAEMRTRVAELLGAEQSLPMMGTFHSICVRILREHGDKIGYETSFTILDTHDTQVLMKRIMREMELSSQQFTPRALLEAISRAKNSLLAPEDFQKQVDSYYDEQIASVYDRYQRALRDANALDFDDLIRLTIVLFRTVPDVLALYQKRFRYILVDEYQDTNHAQYTLVKLLADGHHNIFVVGDDWQSIYKWRGADVSNILNFAKDYPTATIIKLEQNYRSTQTILDAAYGVIAKNASRTDKKIWTDQTGGKKISVFEASDEAQEATYIAQKIIALREEETRAYSDFVVLYRTNAQSRAVEEVFLKNDIPYRIVGGMKFYERKEIKDIIAYARLMRNPYDIVSLERALQEPRRGIGAKTLAQWIDGARREEMDYISFARSDKLKEAVSAPSKCRAIQDFATFVHSAQKFSRRASVREILMHLYENSGYREHLNDGSEEGETRHENVQELLSVATKYDEMPDALPLFLEEVALASDTDTIAQDTDMVHVMTLHSAKGLEFPIVFIIGLEEGLVPHSRSLNHADEMDEERRLMYVGVTRAKEQVYLLFTRQRLLFGSVQMNAPSRFLEDIPQELLTYDTAEHPLNLLNHSYQPQKHKALSTPKITKEKQLHVRDGDKVHHASFGDGVVVASDSDTISVVFKNRGLKKLAREYAHLKKI